MKNENIIVELSGASSATRGKTVKSLEKTGLPLTPIFEGKKSRGNEPEQAKWNLFTTKKKKNSPRQTTTRPDSIIFPKNKFVITDRNFLRKLQQHY